MAYCHHHHRQIWRLSPEQLLLSVSFVPCCPATCSTLIQALLTSLGTKASVSRLLLPTGPCRHCRQNNLSRTFSVSQGHQTQTNPFLWPRAGHQLPLQLQLPPVSAPSPCLTPTSYSIPESYEITHMQKCSTYMIIYKYGT